ncbi:MAG: tRNA pseudouridine(38-40) synthase TruA [Prevotellaceae bacterium]|jgi:tRNA pseudouridine38-40 synthase|nr:tRNA pseudouridine(38-40) synthase TruA [Prevotellaceae bacterium]
MPRYFIQLSYKGTGYHGWQIQPNGNSVQEELTKGLETLLQQKTGVTGAGRTDAGVHAKRMTAHFDTEKPITDLKNFIGKLDCLLPHDIAILGLEEAAPNAHARFDAKSRTYHYYIATRKNPFVKEFAALITFPLDFEAMNRAAETLFDYTDFTSFSKLHTDVKTNNCQIKQAFWKQEDDCWIFTIQADRFLRNMVRAIVGTLIEVGRKKISVKDFRRIIEKKDRCAAGTSAPAKGLFLVDVEY